ncbi:MAG: hypothetical protein D6739_09520 [Nitrospirae bacterium]|nr:MAG: hypothetical protein D6739_09520 [Nitrospirota bacterium]
MRWTRTLLATTAAAALLCAAPAGADHHGHHRHGPKLADQVYALSGGDGGVATVIDARSHRILATLPTGAGGTLGGLTPDGTKLYVGAAAVGQTDVTVIDTRSLTVTGRITTGQRPKHPIVSPDGRWCAVNHFGQARMVIIDTATDQIHKVIDFPVANPNAPGVFMMHSAWSWDSRYLFCQNRKDGLVYALDAFDDFAIAATIPVDSPNHYQVVRPDNSEVWLVNEGNMAAGIPGSIDVVDMDTLQCTAHIVVHVDNPVDPNENVEAHHGNFTLDGSRFLLLNRGPGSLGFGGYTVNVYDADTYALVKSLKLSGNGEGHAYLDPEGKYVVTTVYGNSTVSFLDAKTLTVVKEMAIGTGRHVGHVAFRRHQAFFTNSSDNAVYVVNMKNLKIVDTIPVATGPGQILNTYTSIFEVPGAYVPKVKPFLKE